MMKKIALSLLILMIILPVSVSAAEWYVDASLGNDNHPGTSQSPFKTINRALKALEAGDTIHIGPGDYGEQIFITQDSDYVTLIGDYNGGDSFNIRVLDWRCYADYEQLYEGPCIMINGADGVRIENIGLWGNQIVPGRQPDYDIHLLNADSCLIKNVLLGWYGSGLSGNLGFCLESSDHNRIVGCLFLADVISGVELWSSCYNFIAYNQTQKICLWEGSHSNRVTRNKISGRYIASYQNEKNVIDENLVVNAGIFLCFSDYTIVRRNMIRPSNDEEFSWDRGNCVCFPGYGIPASLESGICQECCSYTIIRDNMIIGQEDYGVCSFMWSSLRTLSGNTVCHNGKDGFLLASTTCDVVTGNEASWNGGDGLCFWGAYRHYGYAGSPLITGNTFHQNGGYGLRFINKIAYDTVVVEENNIIQNDSGSIEILYMGSTLSVPSKNIFYDVRFNCYGTSDSAIIEQLITHRPVPNHDTVTLIWEPFLESWAETTPGAYVPCPRSVTGLRITRDARGRILLLWDPVMELESGETIADFGGYHVYRFLGSETFSAMNEDTGGWSLYYTTSPGETSFVDDTVVVGERYYYKVTAFSDNSFFERESAFSSVEMAVAVAQEEAGSFEDDNCFIASVIFGEGSREVRMLRHFRDGVLLDYRLGRVFTNLYYTHGPLLAAELQVGKKGILLISLFCLGSFLCVVTPAIFFLKNR